jgi:hypothetical protein
MDLNKQDVFGCDIIILELLQLVLKSGFSKQITVR